MDFEKEVPKINKYIEKELSLNNFNDQKLKELYALAYTVFKDYDYSIRKNANGDFINYPYEYITLYGNISELENRMNLENEKGAIRR